MDARQRRTRARLADTILSLAATRPANELTVSEVAARAGINRSTFYQHAVTPADLLETLLADELTEMSAEHLALVTPDNAPTIVTQISLAMGRHVDAHADIYRIGLRDDAVGANLAPMLSRVFTATILEIFDRGDIEFPQRAALRPECQDVFVRTAAGFVAAGSVAAIRVWLDTPAPRDVATYLETTAPLLPEWWPFAAIPEAVAAEAVADEALAAEALQPVA